MSAASPTMRGRRVLAVAKDHGTRRTGPNRASTPPSFASCCPPAVTADVERFRRRISASQRRATRLRRSPSPLLRHLAAIARGAGLWELIAEVLPDNAPMLKVFEKSGLRLSKKRSRASCMSRFGCAGRCCRDSDATGACSKHTLQDDR
jgi:hypothetical protein